MHRGIPCILLSVHRNPPRCRDARFQEFHAWSVRTLFFCPKCFRLVVQTLYPHNSLRSLSLHFYVTNCSKRTGRHLCNACADQEIENLISSPRANSGPQWSNDPRRFQGVYGFFQPGKQIKEIHGLWGTCRCSRQSYETHFHPKLGATAVICDFNTTGYQSVSSDSPDNLPLIV